MTVKVTMANNGSDSVDFLNDAGTTLAQVKAYDDGSSNGHVEIYTSNTGTSSEKVRVQNGLHIQQDASSSNRLVFRGQTSSSYRWNIDNYGSSNDLRIYRENDSDGSSGVVLAGIDSSGNLQFNSGYGSSAKAYGCRAWVNFNGTGTVAIRASGNVSSITDNGTGLYTINFTTAMPDSNFTTTAKCRWVSSGNSINIAMTGSSYSSGSVQLRTGDSSWALIDSVEVSAAIFR